MNNNVIKFLIPLAAVVVILESVILLDKTIGSSQKTTASISSSNQQVVSPSPEVSVQPVQTDIDLVFGVGSKSMVVGKSYPVTLNLISNKSYKVDSIEAYIKYDKDAFSVGTITRDKRLPKPAFETVSKKQSMVVTNYLITDANGLSILPQDTVNVVGFMVTPKKAGTFQFEVNTGNGKLESATMIVENGTAKVIPFTSSPLIVSVANK